MNTNNEPSAWIGCLACYNNGNLNGEWITAEQAAAELENLADTNHLPYAGLAELGTYPSGSHYSQCRECGGDEFDVFDTDNLPQNCQTLNSFYENAGQLNTLHNTGELELICLLATNDSSIDLDDLVTLHADTYAGEHNTTKEFAENHANETELLKNLDPIIISCFDHEHYWDGWLRHNYYEINGHYWAHQ